jgi:hypothetical protein
MHSPDDTAPCPDILCSEDLPNHPGIADQDFYPGRESWRERIILPEKAAGIPLTVLVAGGLGMLSTSLFVPMAFLVLVMPFTWRDTEGPAGVVLVVGVPVHLAALLAGCLVGGMRRDGAGAARLAVVSGTLGTAFFLAEVLCWWAVQRW